MKALRIVLPMILAVGLVLGLALPGLARPERADYQAENYQYQGEPPAWGRVLPKIQTGKVVEVDEGKSYFTIQRGEQEPVEIAVDNSTKYYKVSTPVRAAGLLQKQLTLKPQKQAEATENKPKLINAAKLRKTDGFDQLVSTPTATPVDDSSKNKERGLGQWQQFRRFGQEASFGDVSVGS